MILRHNSVQEFYFKFNKNPNPSMYEDYLIHGQNYQLHDYAPHGYKLVFLKIKKHMKTNWYEQDVLLKQLY